MSAFDGIAALVVDATSAIFGDVAVWNGYSAKVKFKDEAGEAELGKVKFGLDKWTIEAKVTDFPGLKDLLDTNKKELITVTVRGVETQFYAVSSEPLSDGLCIAIRLRLKP